MARRILALCLLLAVVSGIFFVPSVQATNTHAAQAASATAKSSDDFAVVDPNYTYDQLFYMATHFQQRQAGFGSPGHDEFAAYWTQEMLANLQGFGAQARRDPFMSGWFHDPGTTPAFNVEVNVPGAVDPQQIVVIGCHYDGMENSTQSAYDDASGCAIELGVAKALATFWRAHHAYPARTLRFVIFDAEEQNLLGSFHYVNKTVNGDLSNIVAMFNEEQNGVGYPVRYLGNLENPLLPLYINVTPLHSNKLYPGIDKLPPSQLAKISRFRTLIAQAIPAVFQKFRELTYYGLTYHNGHGQDIPEPIFTPGQLSKIQIYPDTGGASDEVLFTKAGIPCATMVSNASYYGNHPPRWAFPFDQPQDTVQLLNTFAVGGTHMSYALALSLALPGMITTWMLNQPDILGQITINRLPAGPIAAISDIGYPQVGATLRLNALAAYDPRNRHAQLIYRWNFGDGQQHSGISVTHIYTKSGWYTLKLTVTSSNGTRVVTKLLHIQAQPATYPNQYPGRAHPINPPNPKVHLPKPDNALRDRIIHHPF